LFQICPVLKGFDFSKHGIDHSLGLLKHCILILILVSTHLKIQFSKSWSQHSKSWS